MINRIIDEINYCLENGLYIAALTMALTLPDACGKAEYPKEKSTKKRYIKWYTEHIGKYEEPATPEGDDMPYMSGEIIYSLRCCLLHQSTPNIEPKDISEKRCKVNNFKLIISSDYDAGTSMVAYGAQGRIVDRSIKINIVNLCKKICRTAKSYYDDNRSKFSFIEFELYDCRNGYDNPTPLID